MHWTFWKLVPCMREGVRVHDTNVRRENYPEIVLAMLWNIGVERNGNNQIRICGVDGYHGYFMYLMDFRWCIFDTYACLDKKTVMTFPSISYYWHSLHCTSARGTLRLKFMIYENPASNLPAVLPKVNCRMNFCSISPKKHA